MPQIKTLLIQTALTVTFISVAIYGATKFILPEPFRTTRSLNYNTATPSVYAPTVGRQYSPNLIDIEHVDSVGTKVISRSKFSTDDHGRRVTPQLGNDQTKSVLFFGCSFTFGRGLNDNETLPAYFAKLVPDLKVYNYAVPGAGPQQMLRWLDSNLLPTTLQVPPKLAVYVFIPQHYSRVVGGFYESADAPFYSLEEGHLKYNGFFSQARPWRSALQKSIEDNPYYPLLTQILPARISGSDEDLLCAIVTRAKDLFVQQFPGIDFVVANYALKYPSPPMTEALRRCAREQNLKLIEYEDLLPPSQAVIDVKYDIHPSALSNKHFAEQLAKEMKK